MNKFQIGVAQARDVLLIGLSAFFCIGTTIAALPRSQQTLPPVHEAFDPALQSINSVDAAVGYVMGQYAGRDPARIAAATDDFVRRRFYHEFSQFTPADDWLAYLAGIAWVNLRMPVIPDDILQYPQAACSQQSMVFEAIVQRFGIEVGSVGLNHHFISAAKINGEWRVYDSNREVAVGSYPLTKLLKGDPAIIALYGRYGRSIDLAGQAARGEIHLTNVNHYPAQHCAIFHRLTHFFSHFGWAIFLGLLLLRFRPTIRLPARLEPAGFAG